MAELGPICAAERAKLKLPLAVLSVPPVNVSQLLVVWFHAWTLTLSPPVRVASPT